MKEFDFVIEQRPGSKHKNADALSRRPCRSRNCICRNPTDAVEEKQFEDEMEQEVDDEDLAREVTACIESCTIRSEGVPEAFIGVAADQLETCVKVVDVETRQSESQQESPVQQCRSSNVSNIDPEMETPWSLAGLQAEQRKDPHINFIIQKFEEGESQPDWDIVALESETVKALWVQWSPLSIKNGLLKRRFETPDGHSVYWQTVAEVTSKKVFRGSS